MLLLLLLLVLCLGAAAWPGMCAGRRRALMLLVSVECLLRPAGRS
jgi:hypothetical protein